MNRINLNFVGIACVLFTALFLFASAGVTNVHADGGLNHLLNGDYAFSQTTHCISNLDGFVGDNNQLPEGGTEAFNQTLFLEGTMHFDGNGAASYDAMVLGFNHGSTSPGSYPVGGSDSHCDFAYNVNPDRSFSKGSTFCTGTMLSGSPLFVGKTFTLTADQFGTGHIQAGSQMLLLSGASANVSTVTFWDFLPGFDLSYNRICNNTGTAVRLP